MERIPNMKYHMELHYGDDNDNNIHSFTMEADSKDDLFDKLEEDFLAHPGGAQDTITVDGDADSLLLMWYENDIPHHHDYYITKD